MSTTTVDADEIRRRYADGESIHGIAEALGHSTATVHGHLSAEVRRPRGRPTRDDIDADEIRRLVDDERLSFREVARRLGLPRSTIQRHYTAG